MRRLHRDTDVFDEHDCFVRKEIEYLSINPHLEHERGERTSNCVRVNLTFGKGQSSSGFS